MDLVKMCDVQLVSVRGVAGVDEDLWLLKIAIMMQLCRFHHPPGVAGGSVRVLKNCWIITVVRGLNGCLVVREKK
jgi:hypothetical protein